MQQHDHVTAGRAAFAERRWADAFAQLSEADNEQPLAFDDMERLARAAAMLGRDDDMGAILERGYERCLAMGQLPAASRAAFWRGFRLMALGETSQGSAWLARCAELVDRQGGECVERGFLLVTESHRLMAEGQPGPAREAALSAAAIGDRFEEADLSALGRQLGGRAAIMAGDVPAGIRLMDEAMLIASGGTASELVRGLVYCGLIASCQRVFAIDRAREWTEALSDWCASQPQLGIFNGTCRVHRAEIMQIGGAWSEALEEVGALVAAPGDTFGRAAASYQRAEILRLRGRFRPAEAAYEEVIELGGDPQPGLALLRMAQGHTEPALAAIRRVVATTSDPLARARVLPALVEIALASSAEEEAQRAADELRRISLACRSAVLGAMAAHAAGSVALSRDDATGALPLLREAFAGWHGLEAPYLAARVRVEIARACELMGDAEGARLERGAARRVFEALEAGPDLERMESADTATAPASHGLSRREVEVLRLAATGLTNKQIAARLGLSDRTVDRHIGNILMKLDVPSRAAATASAYRHGLID